MNSQQGHPMTVTLIGRTGETMVFRIAHTKIKSMVYIMHPSYKGLYENRFGIISGAFGNHFNRWSFKQFAAACKISLEYSKTYDMDPTGLLIDSYEEYVKRRG